MKSIPYSSDIGLLVIRVGIGIMMMLHGLPKLVDGPGAWENLGQYGLPMLPAGIVPMAFGFAAAIAEFGGGLLLVIGFWNRVACLLLIATMAVAFTVHLDAVGGWADFAKNAGWPLELAVVLIGLFIAGPGRFKIGKKT